MESLKNFLIIVIGSISITTANAYQENCEPKPVERECPKICGCDIPGGPTTSAYNQAANIDVCGSWDFYATGSFIWWKTRQDTMSIGEYDIVGNEDAPVQPIADMKFKYKPGFKVGFGYNIGYDNWNTYIQYTRLNFNISQKDFRDSSIGSFRSIWTFGFEAEEITSKWKLNHNILDLEFGRPYYNGKKLTFKPYFGLKGGWINQKMYADFISTSDLRNLIFRGKSESWLIGPRAGINTQWMLGEGFRFFGNGAMSIFYQNFYNIRVIRLNQNAIRDVNIKRDIDHIHNNLELILGLGWGSYFRKNNWHFDLSLGYEMQIYFNQNIIMSTNALDPTVLISSGNLMFDGLSLTARFDF